MQLNPTNSKTFHVKIMLLVVAITCTGFGLRVYRLGENSLWNDESGQALAALTPSISETLQYSRGHTMAMPLDYLVSRVSIHISSSEFVLRLPSVLWGTLAILAIFVLARRLSGLQTAIVATLLLSLSPWHIRYAQEMRFYAALGFFYLLANIALLKAIRQPSRVNWAEFVLVTLVGSYFHLYVALVVINGFICWLFMKSGAPARRKLFAHLSVCSLIIAALIAPGYWYFGGHQTFQYNLLEYGGSLSSILLEGIGWLSFPYTSTTPAFGAWEAFNVVFATVGILVLARRRKANGELVGILLGVLLNIGLILLADYIKGYWFLSRQLIHLAPFAIIVSAIGIVETAITISNLPLHPHRARSASTIFLLTSILAICLTSSQRISQYYAFPKSQAKQIVAAFLEAQHGQEPLFVIPGYEEKIYRYYMIQDGQPDSTIQRVIPTDWQALQQAISTTPSRAYLAVQGMEAIEETSMLRNLGFEQIWSPQTIWYGTHTLWVKK